MGCHERVSPDGGGELHGNQRMRSHGDRWEGNEIRLSIQRSRVQIPSTPPVSSGISHIQRPPPVFSLSVAAEDDSFWA